MITNMNYKKMAEILEKLNAWFPNHNERPIIIDSIINQFANYFKYNNSKFDKNKFLKECGMKVLK